MIVLYSGTPGSGKSLDTAKTIYRWCYRGAPVICNFPLNVDNIRAKRKNIHYIPNGELEPDKLVEFSKEYFKDKRCREDSILVVIDEAQLLFNSRDWSNKGRDRWNWFFTMHRHFGFYIILCAQFDRMLDRQIRGLIEYEYIHRKIKNMGWRGILLSCLLLSPANLFIRVQVWYPMKERVGYELFKCKKRYYSLYDTFVMLDKSDKEKVETVPDLSEEGGSGDPLRECPVQLPVIDEINIDKADDNVSQDKEVSDN